MAPEQQKITALIVDDEREACANLQNILTDYIDADISIIGVAHNTTEAERLITALVPQAIFLDIEMPNENAFHFLDRIAPFNFEVIFVTAYDEYAVHAFRLSAIDYILKPISITELANAVAKLKAKLKYKSIIANADISFTDISRQVKEKAKYQKITLKDGNSIDVVDFKDIYFMEAQGSYSRIVFFKGNGIKEVTMSNTLSDYEELLPADRFYRIHKSYVINCEHITRIVRDDISEVIIRDNYRLPVSRRRFPLLLDFLKSNGLYHE